MKLPYAVLGFGFYVLRFALFALAVSAQDGGFATLATRFRAADGAVNKPAPNPGYQAAAAMERVADFVPETRSDSGIIAPDFGQWPGRKER
ncbi:MAG: hypothetical protein HPY67_13375 [Syntrophaceae bacterium]|nr:hypothetical protein [Syntrophaceae bacterium]